MKRAKHEGVRQGTFEVRKGGAARFDLTDPYHLAVALPWPAFVAGAIASLLLINLGFAALYTLVPGALRGRSQATLSMPSSSASRRSVPSATARSRR